ncbi:MAG: DNA repair protein RecO [Anaerolineales bacterium]|nr:DNA repair protein RecO [Anaerolineales bacterium]
MARKPRSYRVEAIVLRHSDWGEADRIVTSFTREKGKLRAVAKGARKMRSRKAGHLEPFTRVSLLLAVGRSMHIITQAESLEAFLDLREDLTLIGYASSMAELTDRFTIEEEENHSLFRLLGNSLRRLDEGVDPQLATRYFEIRLLDLMGFRPNLTECVERGEEIQPEDQFISAAIGGVVCPRCAPKVRGLRPISMQALKYLRHFQRSSFAEAERAQISPEIYRELEMIMDHYLTYLLERKLNSPVFIREVRPQEDPE